MLVVHFGYLIALSVVGYLVGKRIFERRLAK